MTNPFRWSFRTHCLSGAIICAALLSYALYVQHVQRIEACPLCIFQRIAFITMGVFFLVAAIHGPSGAGRKVYALFVTLAGFAGVGIAGRHLYLQHLPKNEVPDCGPGLGYMLDTFPLSKTLKMVFTGSGECAEVNWVFLGISMPGWTLLCYVLLIVAVIWSASRRV